MISSILAANPRRRAERERERKGTKKKKQILIWITAAAQPTTPYIASCSGRLLARVDVDADGDEEDGDEREVEDGVDEDGQAAGVHAAELCDAAPARQRAEQPRREDHEQHRRYDHGAPVRHRGDLSDSPPPSSFLRLATGALHSPVKKLPQIHTLSLSLLEIGMRSAAVAGFLEG
jgi:hypothetical protein|uniref:Uncharacterized protein n=1 Tax=Zea mays TaxID=4577 RepID=A0A804MHC3_MAIZE